MSSTLKRLSFTVHGDVQGVFYRQFTKESASKLSVTGFVRNTSSGTVAGEAQGSESQLEEFVKKLRQGSSASKVDKVDKEDMEGRVVDGEKGFEIKYVNRKFWMPVPE